MKSFKRSFRTLILALLCISCAGGPITGIGTVAWYKWYGMESEKDCLKPENVPNLVRAATESVNPKIRIQAIRYLGFIGEEAASAITPLCRIMIQDPNRRARQEAERSIHAIGFVENDDIFKMVSESLGHEDPEVRLQAVLFIQKMQFITEGFGEYLEQLESMGKSDPHPNVAGNAVLVSRSLKSMPVYIAESIHSADKGTIRLKAKLQPSYYNGYKYVRIIDKGLLPVKLTIDNQTDTAFRCSATRARLIYPVEQQASLAAFSLVVNASSYLYDKPSSVQANMKIIGFHQRNILNDSPVQPGGTLNGYLFFTFPPVHRDFLDWRIEIDMENAFTQELICLVAKFQG